ncbi:MAG: Hpt domain-containing protein [Terracidiphilus sp.]
MKSSAQSGVSADAVLSQAIDRLWVRFLPEIRERVALLESSAIAVSAKKLTSSRREAAQAAAHKLAGVLGTFNLARGTTLARELEAAFSRESAPGPSAGKRLAAIAAELRAMIENRPSTG